MFCTKCGENNSDRAVYCQKCGEMLEAEEETRVASRAETNLETGNESKVFSISPTLKFVKVGYGFAVIGAFLLAALFAVFLPGISPLVGALLGLLFLLIPAYFHVKQRLTQYTLTDTTIEIDRGLISRTTQNIPLRRIQDVTVSSTVTQRLLGYGDVIVDNASETGGKVILKGIDSPRKYADMLLGRMRQLDR